MATKVLLAEPRGFCAGVEMAIKALTWMVQVYEPPVYCYHEIVHNGAVVTAFKDAGVVFVDDIHEVPNGKPVMLSAHGSAPEVAEEAADGAAVMVDAVCPLVTKVHHEVRRMAGKGYDIIYVGHEGHDEAIGAMAEAPAAAQLVDPRIGLDTFSAGENAKVALLAQTTLGLYEWEGVLSDAQIRFPDLWTARRSDLCYATTNRQSAIQELAERSDVLLVVGSENSSNTKALVRVGTNAGVPTYRVDSASDIDRAWLDGVDTVGVTAGASASEQAVQKVIDSIAPTEGIEKVRVTAEDEYFPLPPNLRRFMAALQPLVEGGFACQNPGAPGPIENDRDFTATEALALLGV
ncbi:MAG: 4-hydroxy-3-methylbut-2-enyl diphosphate reductase [Acidimicrobiia bacterium]|nr:MAG: 4-hydroxy-3-methylbut-2-enyl diphosphate reductase [Acidimicrobiia bacterium]